MDKRPSTPPNVAPSCPINRSSHIDIKLAHPEWVICPTCGLDLPITYEIVDTPVRSLIKDEGGSTKVSVPALLIPGASSTVQKRTTPASFGEATETAIRDRARSIQETRRIKQPITATISLSLYSGEYTNAKVGVLLCRRYTTISLFQRYNPCAILLDESHATHKLFITALLERYNIEPVVHSSDWRFVSAVTTGNGPSVTELATRTTKIVCLRELLNAIFPGQEKDNYQLILFTAEEVTADQSETKKGQASSKKGKGVKKTQEVVKEDDAKGNAKGHKRATTTGRRTIKTKDFEPIKYGSDDGLSEMIKHENPLIKTEQIAIKSELSSTPKLKDGVVAFEMNTRHTTRKRRISQLTTTEIPETEDVLDLTGVDDESAE